MVDERVHMIAFACAAIFTVGCLGFIVNMLWPYRTQLGIALTISVCLVLCLGIVELTGQVIHRWKMRNREEKRALLHASVIEAAGIAAYMNASGSIYHLSAYQENAKTFPVQFEDTTLEEAEEVKRLASTGQSERAIAGRMNMSRSAVRVLLGKPRTKKEEET